MGVSVSVVLACALPLRAQDCDCDHRIALDVTGFDAGAEGVLPGERICVMAGT